MLRPLTPQIYAGRSFNQVGDKRSADPRRNLEKVVAPIRVSANVFAHV